MTGKAPVDKDDPTAFSATFEGSVRGSNRLAAPREKWRHDKKSLFEGRDPQTGREHRRKWTCRI
ncbi:hypothetical protein ABG088_03220 [Hydrogenibacillus schlegelii]|uniref:Uncharacterized protein n=1 Tax=Hydrogenibacillus schlegelii TaxID=1484 RepID=A0A132MZF8_HYDSH|nr:hypothetical protein TR75_08905 [Hydrogenibacillus schlegelii]OAR04379.1 hypothetical protein SA87_12270 [Hydrogenibacillus schlegelii]